MTSQKSRSRGDRERFSFALSSARFFRTFKKGVYLRSVRVSSSPPILNAENTKPQHARKLAKPRTFPHRRSRRRRFRPFPMLRSGHRFAPVSVSRDGRAVPAVSAFVRSASVCALRRHAAAEALPPYSRIVDRAFRKIIVASPPVIVAP